MPARWSWQPMCLAVLLALLGLALLYLGAARGSPFLAEEVLAQACASTIEFGQRIECSMATAEEVHTYRLSADAGDRLLVRMAGVGLSIVQPKIQLRGPDGDIICEASDLGPMAEINACSVLVSGQYRLDVNGQRSAEGFAGYTADYALVAQRLNDPAGCVEMSYGDVQSRTIGTQADLGLFCFDGAAGDIVHIVMAATSGGLHSHVRVFDGRGVQRCEADDLAGLFGQDPGDIECELERSGKHAIVAADNGGISTGSYDLSLELSSGGSGSVGETPATTETPARETTPDEANELDGTKTPRPTTIPGSQDEDGSGGSGGTLAVFVVAGLASAAFAGVYVRRRWQ